MIKQKMKGLTPITLRTILSLNIVILLIIASVSFWFFRVQLVGYAEQVNSDAQAANVSNNDIANLQRLKVELEEDAVAINRAKSIVADSKSYQYQNQIINDLNTYAKKAGVAIATYDFLSDSTSSTTGTSPTPSATATAPTAETPAAETAAPASLKSTGVSITLRTPVDYKAVMRFIHAIELNLTKMQLSGISLKKDTPEANEVSISPLTIEVYIK